MINYTNPNSILFEAPVLHYIVNGGIRGELDSLKVSIVATNPTNKKKLRVKVELYEYKQVEKVAGELAAKLCVEPYQVEQELNLLTDELEKYRSSLSRSSVIEIPELTPEYKKKCIGFLKHTDLLDRINKLLGSGGIVGEDKNRILLFIISISFITKKPLHVIVQGTSGSGKTHLMHQVTQYIPVESIIKITRATENSFYYYDHGALENKLVCIEDLDGLGEEALYALRELQSNGVLTTSLSYRNEFGQLSTQIKTVKGPIATIATSTKGSIYEDNLGRSILIQVDESREQTQKILDFQLQSVQINQKNEIELLQQSIRLLKNYPVENFYLESIRLPIQLQKVRRLNEILKGFTNQITLLHQYQREVKNGVLIGTKDDLSRALELLMDSIWLKMDELDGGIRSFYESLKNYVQSVDKNHVFSQKEIRSKLHITKSQLQRYIQELVQLEYIQVTGGYKNKGYQYRIIEWDEVTGSKESLKKLLLDQLEKPVNPKQVGSL